MSRYDITYRWSRGTDLPVTNRSPLGPAGPRLLGGRVVERSSRVTWSLFGSIAVHACMAFAVVMIARRIAPPDQPAAKMITMVFEPPASELAPPVPSAVPAPSVPEPVAAPAPPPMPEPPAAPPPPPSPPQPLASPVTAVLPESPPPPLAPMPEPAPVPLPPPPAPHPPPRRPAKEPPRSQSAIARPAAPSPVQPPPAQDAAPAPTTTPRQTVVSADWRSALGAWLQAHKTYPEEARRRGEEGRAIVRFTADHDGHVLEVHLVSSTGSAVLDAAVEQLLRSARLPAFPPSMTETEVTVSLQIRYSLER
jgi:periplasmic protein TonB